MKRIELSAQNHTPVSRCGSPVEQARDIAASTACVPPRRLSLLRILLLSLAAAGLLSGIPAFAVNPQALDILVKGMESPAAPKFAEGSDVLIFSYREAAPARWVAARFEHENFSVLHEFSRNEFGVFVLDFPVPPGRRSLRYRICVDGLWMRDPSNPLIQTDELGTEFSLVTLEQEPPRPITSPDIGKDGRATFAFQGRPSGRVSIVADWNCWDPFLDFLKETEPGRYTISLRVPPGRHWYYFLADGQRVLDPANPATGRDPEGRRVSYFSLPPG